MGGELEGLVYKWNEKKQACPAGTAKNPSASRLPYAACSFLGNSSGIFLGLLSSHTRLAVGNMLLNSGDSRLCLLLRFFVIFCRGRSLFRNARCILLAAWVA